VFAVAAKGEEEEEEEGGKMDDYQQAKREFDLVVSNALEDSPSRQLARQKLQKVRSLRGGAASSPLYHAVLEDMIGGLGSGKKRHGAASAGTPSHSHSAPTKSGFVVFFGRRVPRAELQGASLYKVARLWMLDSPSTEAASDAPIDVFNMPPLAAPSEPPLRAQRSGDQNKSKRVEALIRGKRERADSIEELRQQMLQSAKKSRQQELARLAAVEKNSSARLLHLEARTNVSLHNK
jgi:hypothetical protein